MRWVGSGNPAKDISEEFYIVLESEKCNSHASYRYKLVELLVMNLTKEL